MRFSSKPRFSKGKTAASSCPPNPRAASSEATRCTLVTRSSKSPSRTISHSKPSSSVRRSTFDPDSAATESSSSCSSFSVRTKSPAESALKQPPAGGVLELLPPEEDVAQAQALRDRAAHLASDLRQGLQPLLERWMRHEEAACPRLPVGRDDEERIHPLDLAQVLLRNLRDTARDLLQRAHQVLGRACD